MKVNEKGILNQLNKDGLKHIKTTGIHNYIKVYNSLCKKCQRRIFQKVARGRPATFNDFCIDCKKKAEDIMKE